MRRIGFALLVAALVLSAAALAEEPVVIPIVTMTVVSLEDPTPSPTPAATPTPKVTASPEVTAAPSVTIVPAVTVTAIPVTPEPSPAAQPTPAAEAMLMADGQPATTMSVGGIFAGESTVLGSGIPRSAITSIRFEDHLTGAPADAWDVSADRNGSVLAWVEDGALTVAAEGGVRANPDSGHLFAGYSAATEIDFNGCFYTSGATDMSHMFESCWALESLDVSQLDTSSAVDMSYMFGSCPELRALDVSGFDTGRALSMEGMFLLDAKLEQLDLSGFDTSNVSNMRSMFEGCSSLASLDLTRFDMAKIGDMRSMFGDCAALKLVSFGSGFAADADATGMFEGCPALLRIDGRTIDAQQWSNLGSYAGLKRWSRGDGVRWLQTKLVQAGYDPGDIDGVLGPRTEAALKAWQGDHGFAASGVTDAEQVWALFE